MTAALDVVIVTYQSARHLADAVGALEPGTRVIVVDNNSTDGSADLAESLGCEVLRNDENAGFGRAVNRAFREAVRADVVLLLNPDAVVLPADVQQLVAAVDEPGVAVAGPRLVHEDGTPQRPWWPFPSVGGAWREALGLHVLRRPRYDVDADVPFVVGACFAVRADAFRSVGGFDERYWLYGEEADLCRRLTDAGQRVRYVANATATHIGGASGGDINALVSEHFVRGSERFVLTYEGSAALVAYRFANLMGTCMRIPMLRRDDPRRATRRFQARRIARSLVRHPTTVFEPGLTLQERGLVVLGESWCDADDGTVEAIRRLVAADPSLRVLWVEPPVGGWPRSPRVERVAGLPQVCRFVPRRVPARLWGADRLQAHSILAAAVRAEVEDPDLWLAAAGTTPVAMHLPWPTVGDLRGAGAVAISPATPTGNPLVGSV